MSSVHLIKLILLGLLLFPVALFAQTSTTGRIDEGPLAARPTVCTPGDYYVTTDTNPVVEYKCSTGNVWNQEAGGGGGGTPGGVNGDTQCKNGAIFVACGQNTAILYVSTTGNDTNSGKTWDTAKLTIMAAVCALPTGNCSTTPKQAGSGTVYFTSGVFCNSVATAGCWIAGSGDSQYPNMTGSTSGPTAWTIDDIHGDQTLNLICATWDQGTTNISRPFCNVEGPNHTVGGGYLPIFWATGNSLGSFYVNGLSGGQFAGGVFSATWGRIGIDSATGAITGTPTVTQTVGWTIENVYSANDTGAGLLGGGPQLAIGNGFWMHIHDSGFGPSIPEGCTVAGASRTSNVVTITTSNCSQGAVTTQCPFLNGDHVSIRDTTGDGTFNGTFTATSSCGATNTVTFAQTGPNFSGSVGSNGIIVDDRAFGIVCYSCQIEMARMHNSGGLKFYSGPSSNLQFNDNYIEGTGAQTAPMVWISPLIYGGGGLVDISGQFQSDTPLLPAMINEGGPQVFVHTEASQSTNIRGPAIVLNGNDATSRTTGLLASGQSGWLNNQYMEFQSDIARRQVPLTASTFTNLAPQNPASWTGGGFTVASGKRDPFGGTGAIELDSATSATPFIYSVAQTVNVGDIWYFGAWVRAPNANVTQPLAFYLGAGNTCVLNTAQPYSPFLQFSPGDGNWYWLTSSCTVWSTAGSSTVTLATATSSTAPIQLYRPFVVRVPVGTASLTEVTDELNSLGFGPSTQASPGDIVYPADKRMGISSGSATNEFLGFFNHSNTANRTYALPDQSGGTVALEIGPGNITQQILTAQNGSPANFLSPGLLDGNGGSGVTSTPYTVQCDSATTLLDRAHIIRFQVGASVVNVPSSTATGCTGGFVFTVIDESAGTLTFNRTSTDTFSIYNGGITVSPGATSFTLANGQYATLNQGATGIWEVRITGAGVGAGASPLVAWYLSPNCPLSNTGQCFNTPANTQISQACSYSSANANVTCFTTLSQLSGSVTSNVATYTSPVPIPTTWASGNVVTVAGFQGTDTYFNASCTLSTVTTTTFTCPLTHANGTSTTFGLVANQNVGPFVASDVGKRIFGYQTCSVFENISGGNSPMSTNTATLTITTFNSSISVTMSGNPLNTATFSLLQPRPGGCVIWGNPDDAGAAAMDASMGNATACPRAMLAAANYMFTVPHFYANPNGCASIQNSYPNSFTLGNLFYSAGFELEGRGPGATILYLTPGFPETGAGCVNGLSKAACWDIPVEGRWSDFQISGGGNYQSLNIPNGTYLVEVDGPAQVDNYVCTNWAMLPATSNVTNGILATFWAQLNRVNISECGSSNMTVAVGAVVSAVRLGLEGPGVNGYDLSTGFVTTPSVPNGTNAAAFDKYNFTCYECRFWTGLNGASGMILANGGSIKLYHSAISPNTDPTNNLVGYTCTASHTCVFDIEDTAIDMNYGGHGAGTGNVAVKALGSLIFTVKNSYLNGSSTGSPYTDNAGSLLIDEGDNIIGTTASPSVTGKVTGEINSANTTGLIAGNTVLSAGWGSTAAATGQSGGNAPIKFTITNSGTGQAASPTITYTFPTPYLIAPFSCTATQIGGTNAIGTFASSVPTTTGVVFTFSLTPTASSTEIVQVTCVTP